MADNQITLLESEYLANAEATLTNDTFTFNFVGIDDPAVLSTDLSFSIVGVDPVFQSLQIEGLEVPLA